MLCANPKVEMGTRSKTCASEDGQNIEISKQNNEIVARPCWPALNVENKIMPNIATKSYSINTFEINKFI